MKAAVLRAFGEPLRWEDVDTPAPGPDEALVQVMACGIDGTDLKLLDGFGYTPDLPFIMGHEVAGVVTGLGLHQLADLGLRRVTVHELPDKLTQLFLFLSEGEVHLVRSSSVPDTGPTFY